MNRSPLLRAAAAVALGALLTLAAACGGDDSEDTTTTAAAAESTTTTGAPAEEGTIVVTSESFDMTFAVSACTSESETDVALEADADGVGLRLTAFGGNGAVKIEGGSEADRVDLEGDVEGLQVGDAGDITATGAFAGPELAGEELTISGSCVVEDASASSTTTTEAGAKDVASAPNEELKVWQTDLNIVGCYVGSVDGVSGPQTVAAVKAFQAASGLSPDGRIGPRTQAALKEAAASKEHVCLATASGGSTGQATSQKVLKVSSPQYDKSFAIGSCTSSGESSVRLQAQADNLTAVVDVSNGSGTLAISGGTEEDGITLNGSITSLSVGDAGNVSGSGTFGAPNFAGTAFTFSGSCA